MRQGGFSTKTALPARSARQVSSAWLSCRVAIAISAAARGRRARRRHERRARDRHPLGHAGRRQAGGAGDGDELEAGRLDAGQQDARREAARADQSDGRAVEVDAPRLLAGAGATVGLLVLDDDAQRRGGRGDEAVVGLRGLSDRDALGDEAADVEPPGARSAGGTPPCCGARSSARSRSGSRCRAPRRCGRSDRGRTSATGAGRSPCRSTARAGCCMPTSPTITTRPRSRHSAAASCTGSSDDVAAVISTASQLADAGRQAGRVEAPARRQHIDRAGLLGALEQASASKSTPTTVQPAARSSMPASWPTRPCPMTATRSPRRTSAWRTPCIAIDPTVANAPCSKLSASGRRTQRLPGTWSISA